VEIAIRRARELAPPTARVEIECITVDQVSAAAEAGADIILLDNMPLDLMVECVKVTARRAELEASGGVTLDNVRAIAGTGVDMISIGALTHSAAALNLALDFE
jgi:nicotinate-nucleotide pyrophosphorylase (carboxylating)